MPTPRTLTDNNIALDAGQQYYPSAAGRDVSVLLNKGYTNELFSMDLSPWAPGDQISVYSEYSIDNWQTVMPGGGTVTVGGVHHDHQGNVTTVLFNGKVPDLSQGTTLLERINITVPSPGVVPLAQVTIS